MEKRLKHMHEQFIDKGGCLFLIYYSQGHFIYNNDVEIQEDGIDYLLYVWKRSDTWGVDCFCAG